MQNQLVEKNQSRRGDQSKLFLFNIRRILQCVLHWYKGKKLDNGSIYL